MEGSAGDEMAPECSVPASLPLATASRRAVRCAVCRPGCCLPPQAELSIVRPPPARQCAQLRLLQCRCCCWRRSCVILPVFASSKQWRAPLHLLSLPLDRADRLGETAPLQSAQATPSAAACFRERAERGRSGRCGASRSELVRSGMGAVGQYPSARSVRLDSGADALDDELQSVGSCTSECL